MTAAKVRLLLLLLPFNIGALLGEEDPGIDS